ncbi:MAG: thiamine-phosphate kinase [Ignavibacteria bacterium]|jgi:thiamine-monophosphate kinase
MKLSELGEFGLINRIAPLFLKNLDESITGIGDDCSVIPFNKNESLLITTDMLIEDVHFLCDKISPEELGYKSLAVNLSDIAAMGGNPQSAFLSIGIPKNTEIPWLDAFFNGIKNLADETNTLLLGGDTTKSIDRLVINIVVVGKAENSKIKYRSAAKPGNVICVTENIGDSGGGLKIILENLEDKSDEDICHLIKAHHKPRPHLKEGQWLSAKAGVNAMIDVSDGIDSDIRRIMEQSHIGAKVNLEDVPISSSLKRISGKFNWDPYEIAAVSGEDYCLLVTIDKEKYTDIAESFKKEFNSPLYKIGEITDRKYELEYFNKNTPVLLGKHGFDHFNQ